MKNKGSRRVIVNFIHAELHLYNQNNPSIFARNNHLLTLYAFIVINTCIKNN